eukprot:1161235-Pelagomonas_calceolata.AAC.19
MLILLRQPNGQQGRAVEETLRVHRDLQAGQARERRHGQRHIINKGSHFGLRAAMRILPDSSLLSLTETPTSILRVIC